MNAYLVPILLAIGVFTLGALPQLLVPKLFLSRVTFGVQTQDAFTLLLARHWAVLAALVGAFLIYAAFHPEVRGPAMAIAAAEKLALAALIFFGSWPRTAAATRTAAVDALAALVLVLALASL